MYAEFRNSRELKELLALGMPARSPSEAIRACGEMQLTLIRPDGSGIRMRKPNLITTVGWDLLCDVLGKVSQPSDLTHIAIGSGSAAAAVGNTALANELHREAAAYTHNTGTKVMSLRATFAEGDGTGTVREAGCLNASTGGVLFNRVVFGAVTKAAGDTLVQEFTFTFS